MAHSVQLCFDWLYSLNAGKVELLYPGGALFVKPGKLFYLEGTCHYFALDQHLDMVQLAIDSCA